MSNHRPTGITHTGAHNFQIGGGTAPTRAPRPISLDRHETGKTTPSQGRPVQLTRIDEINKNITYLTEHSALFPGNQVRNEVARLVKEREELRGTAPTMNRKITQESDYGLTIDEYKKGGTVKKTGMALVHKGEYVVPSKDAAKVKKFLKESKKTKNKK